MGKGHQHHHKKNDKKQVDTLEPILKEFREDQGTDNSGAQCMLKNSSHFL